MNPKLRTKRGQGALRHPHLFVLRVQNGDACTPPSQKSRGGEPNKDGPFHRLSCFECLIGLKFSLTPFCDDFVFRDDGEGTIKAV